MSELRKATFPVATIQDYAQFQERIGDPGALANHGRVYTKDIAGTTQLFYQDDSGAVVQLTPTTAGNNTLDQAYDQGGAGAGRTITADSGAVVINNAVVDATNTLEVTRTGGTGVALLITGDQQMNTTSRINFDDVSSYIRHDGTHLEVIDDADLRLGFDTSEIVYSATGVVPNTIATWGVSATSTTLQTTGGAGANQRTTFNVQGKGAMNARIQTTWGAGGTAFTQLEQLLAGFQINFGAGITSCQINTSNVDCDFRVQGTTDVNLLSTDAGNDRVGVGQAAPAAKLEVTGVAADPITLRLTHPTISTPVLQMDGTLTGELAFQTGSVGWEMLQVGSASGFLRYMPNATFPQIQIGDPTGITAAYIDVMAGGVADIPLYINVLGGAGNVAVTTFGPGGISIIERASDLSAISGEGRLYVKTIGTTSRLHARDEDGEITQLTPKVEGELYHDGGVCPVSGPLAIGPLGPCAANYVVVTGLTSGISNFTTLTPAAGTITITEAGDYDVEVTMSFTTTDPNREVVGEVFVGGVRSAKGIAFRRNLTANDYGVVSCRGRLTLAVGAILDFRLTTITSATSVEIAYMNFSVRKVKV